MEANEKPTREMIDRYVNSSLWNELCSNIEETYAVKPLIEYSKCKMQPGWNMKYKKSGRALATFYPMEGYFLALVVIGNHEKELTELVLSSFSEYLQKLYADTEICMGQKWLMIEVKDSKVLRDVKELISIRQKCRKKTK